MTEINPIREARLEDIDRLISWGERFHAASSWRHAPYSPDAVRRTLTEIIQSERAVVLMHNHGMIGGFLTPVWLSENHDLAHELFWYCEKKGEGKRLLNAFEDWAKRLGAKDIVMVGLEYNREKIDGIYRHMGYSPIEQSYLKRI